MGIVILIWIVCAIIGSIIASGKGRNSIGGFFLGLLLGPLGVIIAAVLPSVKQQQEQQAQQTGQSGDYRKCPYCAEAIRKEAVKCRYCGSEVEPAASSAAEGR